MHPVATDQDKPNKGIYCITTADRVAVWFSIFALNPQAETLRLLTLNCSMRVEYGAEHQIAELSHLSTFVAPVLTHDQHILCHVRTP